MININNLTVEVEGARVLRNINLDIPEGEVHLLLGPNGSGKTSLMMTITGYPQYKIVEGNISMMGKDLADLDITDRARLGIGMAEQRPPSIDGVKLRMLLDYLLADHPERRNDIRKLIATTNMESFLDRNINEGLSGGEIKRSEILLLISRQPLFAMLDEPDSGVDIDGLELLSSMINTLFSPMRDIPAKRRTGLIITHSNRMAEYIHVDKTHVMLGGELICSGNPQIIMNKIVTSGFGSCVECKRNESIS
ncbi:ABC transporter ATP-binding protein [Sediminispirochaeta bajacaliforniensis]|uniref:ABC transporter ATP-binding protein n=1 Tax=Sediminispirochaeta bajacaliforniensis TaxID=148 RepID=UPI00036AF137|nr:ABC transporter ATP-binding protein [Sediminispirochaeta bajacaliforniensis]